MLRNDDFNVLAYWVILAKHAKLKTPREDKKHFGPVGELEGIPVIRVKITEIWTEGKLNLVRINVDLESSELELWKFYFKCFNNSSQFKPNVNWVTCHISFRADFSVI